MNKQNKKIRKKLKKLATIEAPPNIMELNKEEKNATIGYHPTSRVPTLYTLYIHNQLNIYIYTYDFICFPHMHWHLPTALVLPMPWWWHAVSSTPSEGAGPHGWRNHSLGVGLGGEVFGKWSRHGTLHSSEHSCGKSLCLMGKIHYMILQRQRQTPHLRTRLSIINGPCSIAILIPNAVPRQLVYKETQFCILFKGLGWGGC